VATDKDRNAASSPPADAGASGSSAAAASSGSIDVEVAGSGSIDVQVSGSNLPSDGTPGAVARDDSRPISSGRVAVGAASEPDSRSKRIADAAKDALDVGVSKLGSGLGTIGEGVSRLGEGVSKLKVPVVGTGVAKIGEGISSVGESLHVLPQVARTRRGRLLIRSMVVGFVLVAAWIVVIVGLQLHGNETPDFRPNAERILVGLSKGAIEEIYEQASPRFQEMVRKERFSDDMTDLAETVGEFREITAVNDSLVTHGATGRIGRVSLTVAYDKAICKVSVSLHDDRGRWKLLGIGVELPPELKISQAQREQRVKACKDPMDIKHCDVHQAADAILQQVRDGNADKAWDAATPVFQMQEQKAKFVQLQHEHQFVLGNYRRIIAVTEAKVIGGTSATLDTLAEFDKASGVRVVFGFERGSRLDPWKLASFKVVLPMPRGAENTFPEAPAEPAPDEPVVPDAPVVPSVPVPGATTPSARSAPATPAPSPVAPRDPGTR
jgi:hypothetical protein